MIRFSKENFLTDFKNYFEITPKNEDNIKRTLSLFFQIKLNEFQSTETGLTLLLETQDYIEKRGEINNKKEVKKITTFFLNEYKEELLLSFNPEDLDHITYKELDYYFSHKDELLKFFYNFRALLNSNYKYNDKIKEVFSKEELKTICPALEKIYRSTLIDFSQISVLKKLFLNNYGFSIRNTKEIALLLKNEKNIKNYFYNNKNHTYNVVENTILKSKEYTDEEKELIIYVIKKLVDFPI